MNASTRTIALFALVLVANAVSGWAWMHRNGFLVRPVAQEYAATRSHGVEFVLAAERGPAAVFRWLGEYRWHHGPVLAVSAGLVGLIGGDRLVGPVSTWITTCVVFGTLLLVGTWRLATGLGMSRRLALASTALCATAPVVACYQRAFFHQMPMAALVTLAIAEMIRTAGFTKMGPSLRAGILVGLAVLAKNVAPIYLAGPALAELFFHRPAGSWRRALTGAALGLLASAALVVPWLAASWHVIVDYAKWGVENFSGMWPTLHVDRWLYLPRAIFNNGFGQVPCLALLVGVFAPRGMRGSGVDLRVPVAQIVVSWLTLVFLQQNTESCFLLSWMPVLAVTAVELARRWFRAAPWLGRVMILLLVAGAALDVALVQRGIYEDRPGMIFYGFQFPPQTDHYLVAKVAPCDVVASSEPERWPMAEFAGAVLQPPLGRVPVVLSSHELLSGENLRCLALLEGRDIQPRPAPSLDRRKWPSDVLASDFFVHDDRYSTLAQAFEVLAANHIEAEVVLRVPVIGERAVTLFRVLPAAPESR